MSRVAFTRFCRQIHHSAKIRVREGGQADLGNAKIFTAPVTAFPPLGEKAFWPYSSKIYDILKFTWSLTMIENLRVWLTEWGINMKNLQYWRSCRIWKLSSMLPKPCLLLAVHQLILGRTLQSRPNFWEQEWSNPGILRRWIEQSRKYSFSGEIRGRLETFSVFDLIIWSDNWEEKFLQKQLLLLQFKTLATNSVWCLWWW